MSTPALCTAALAALILAGCGGADSAPDDAPPRAAARLANRQAGARQPQPGTADPAAATAAGAPRPADEPGPTAGPVHAADPVPALAAAATAPSLPRQLAARPAAAQKLVLAYYADYPNNYRALTSTAASYNTVAVDFWNITSQGTITGNGADAPDDAIAYLKQRHTPIYACISNVQDNNWSAAIAHAVAGPQRSAAVRNLVAFARRNGFAGINIDFEAVDQGDRANLSAFSGALATALHAQGMKLIMTVPAFSAKDERHSYNYAFDLAALGKWADYLQIMTYDEAIPAWAPGPVAGSGWMEDALDYAVSKAPAAKILNGIPAYGYDWRMEGQGSQLYWNALPALLAQTGVTPRYDGGSNAITFNYDGADGQHTVWLENGDSVALKAGLVNAYGLAGTSVYALGMEDAAFWQALQAGLRR